MVGQKTKFFLNSHCDVYMQKLFIQKSFNEITNQFDGKQILS